MIDILPFAIIGSTLLSLGFTVYLTKKAEKKTRDTLESLSGDLQEGLVALNSQLEPIVTANSRAMGAISSLSNDTKMDQALERRIGADLIAQNEDIIEVVKMAFPRVAEYIEDRPEAVTKLLPRINTLISDPEARKRLNLDLKSKGGDLSRIWNEGRE